MSNLFWVFVVTFMLGAVPTSDADTVTGVVKKKLPVPIFYTSYIPIVHEVALPSWVAEDLKVKWLQSGHTSSCPSEAVSYWGQVGCPSVYNYNTVIENFYTKTMPEQIAKPEVPSNTLSIQPENVFCNEIIGHFSNSHIDPQSWNKYWKSLNDCPLGEGFKAQKISTYSKLNLAVFDTLLQSFYYRVVSNIGRSSEGAGTYTNAYSAYQASALLHHLVESDRWKDAFAQCGSKQLPRSLITQDTLKSSLSQAETKLTAKQFNSSMAVDNLNSFYELPLTECIFSSTNTSYIIRTLVPAIPSHSKYKLIALEPTPFTLKYNSSSNVNLLCGMDGIQGKYIYDEVTGFISKTDCKSHELCRIPDLGDFTTTDPCIIAIFENNTELIKRFCKTKCVELSTTRFPFFRRLDSDKYAVVGSGRFQSHSESDIFINCRGKPYKVISPNNTGALEVTLPCYCKIIYKSEELHSYEPCGSDKVIIREITPLVPDDTLSSERENITSKIIATTPNPTTTMANPQLQETIPETTSQLIQDLVYSLLKNDTRDESTNEKVETLESQVCFLWIVIAVYTIVIIILFSTMLMYGRNLTNKMQQSEDGDSREQFGLRQRSNIYDDPMIIMDK